MPILPAKMKILLILEKKSENNKKTFPAFPVMHYFTRKLELVSDILWLIVDSNFRNLENFNFFKNNILKFIRPKPISFFNSCSFKRIRLITRISLELSHLRDRFFK